MSRRLPVVRSDKVIKALELAGFEHVRTRGSHAMLRQVGIEADVFVELLDGGLPTVRLGKQIDEDDVRSVDDE